jgi:beta-lactam-binding protein with PASTA domain
MGRFLKVLLYLFLMAGVGLGSGYLAMRWALGVGEVPVPAIVGRHVVEALESLGAVGLNLELRGREFDPVVALHHVVRQDPPAGHPVRRGRRVAVILSGGTKEARVPDLKGEPVSRAQSLLGGLGFQVGRVVSTYSPTHPENTIISQDPGPHETAERGRSLHILVSQGRQEAAYLMPDLIGRDLNRAVSALQAYSLRVGKVSREEYPGLGPDVVIRQEPKAGYRVSRGEVVQLVVARPPQGASGGTGKYVYLRYRLPEDRGETAVRVVVVQGGSPRDVFKGTKRGGEEVGALIRAEGPTKAQVYLDGKLVEEKAY